MSKLYAYSRTGSVFTPLDMVNNTQSIQWLEEYQDVGEVKLVAAATEKNLALLVVGNYLYHEEHLEIGRICETNIVDDAKNPIITVRCVLSVEAFAQRVVLRTETITEAETGMLSIARKNLRGLPVGLPQSTGMNIAHEQQISWGSVLDAFHAIAVGSGVGYRVLFNPVTLAQTLQLYQGTDRTQTTQAYNGYFGDDIRTISAIEITSDDIAYKNIAIVAGEGEGADRVVVTVNLLPESNDNGDCNELFVDARDVPSKYTIVTDTGEVDANGNPIYEYPEYTYTASEYAELLTQRGLEALVEYTKQFDVKADVTNTVFQHGKDFFLGDIVPIKIAKYGILRTARVSAINTIYESTGKRVTATLAIT